MLGRAVDVGTEVEHRRAAVRHGHALERGHDVLAGEPASHRNVEALARESATGPALLVGTPWVEDGKLYNAYVLLSGQGVTVVRATTAEAAASALRSEQNSTLVIAPTALAAGSSLPACPLLALPLAKENELRYSLCAPLTAIGGFLGPRQLTSPAFKERSPSSDRMYRGVTAEAPR